jgi:hypothetical protein
MDAACMLTVIGAGSLSLAMLANHRIHGAWCIASGALAALAGIVVLIVHPLDRGFAHRLKARRYAALDVASTHMEIENLRRELHEVQKITAREIEPLHDIVHNDLMLETGHLDRVRPLRFHQKLLCEMTRPTAPPAPRPVRRLELEKEAW